MCWCCMKRVTNDNLPQMNVAKHEIEEALKIVCESHHLSLAQVWMPNSIVKQGTTFVTRLCGYCHRDAYNDDDDDGVMNYYDACDMLPLKMGEGLAGMTLETHEPLFSVNLSKLTRTLKKKGGLLGQLCWDTECSCLVICLRLRSGLTRYAFEFLWTKTPNHSILLKSLLMCLPSFHIYSGAQLGDEIHVVDLDRCTRDEIASFRLSASSLKEELQIPLVLVKRKLCALYDGDKDQTESDSDYDYDSDDDDDDDLYFVADYKGTLNLLILKSSYKLADAKQRVEKALNLDPEAYTMTYKVNGIEVRLDTDEKLVSSWRKGENGASPQHVMFTVCVRSDQQYVAR